MDFFDLGEAPSKKIELEEQRPGSANPYVPPPVPGQGDPVKPPPGRPDPKPPSPSTVLSGNAKAEYAISWRSEVESYFKSVVGGREGFIIRASKVELTPEDVSKFALCLEKASEKGVPFGQYIVVWGVLQEEVSFLADKYPRIARAIKVSREKRMWPLMESVLSRAHTSPNTALKLLQDDQYTGDVLSEEDKRNANLDIEKRAERILLDNNIEPCEYAQVLVLQGDLPTIDYTPTTKDYENIGLSSEEVLQLFSSGQKP